MRKILYSTLAFATSLTMWAEGYQVNSLSVRQEGMGHTGVAQKLGAESMIFNPAGMAFMDKSVDLSFGISPIFSDISATLEDGRKFETDSKASTPFQVSGAFSIYDNLKAGITINTPYGSGIDWTENWPGAVLSQSVKLQVFNVQPTIAYKILPNLSVGAGLMISWGTIDLNKGLVNSETFDKLLTLQNIPEEKHLKGTTPASVNLKGTAEIAFGFNVGAMWDINDKITVGANYRSKMDMKVKSGDAKLSYANDIAANALNSITGLDGANFSAQLPAVSVLSLGVSYKPIKRLTLAFDAQLSGWSAYDKLEIDFLGEKLGTQFDQSLTKNYKDSWAYRFGAQYAMTDRLDLRAGFSIDTTPVDENYFNPETPGMTRLLPSCGLSFRPTEKLAIDLAFTYVAGCSRNGANTYTDLLAASAYQSAYQSALGAGADENLAKATAEATAAALGGVEKTFKAKYDLRALIPGIGIRYSF